MSTRPLSPGELASAAALREATKAIREARARRWSTPTTSSESSPNQKRPELELVRTEDDDA